MQTKRKAVQVLVTLATASNEPEAPIVNSPILHGKDFSTLQAELALIGHRLTRCHRAHDGLITFAVTRNEQARYFTHWHDVQAHHAALVQIIRPPVRATQASKVPTFHKNDSYDSEFD